MAKFKVQIERQSFLTLEVVAKNKLDASLLATHKAKNKEGWYNDHYNVINVIPL